MPEVPVNWLNMLVVYGPLGIFAAIVGFVYLMKVVKGDPVMKLAETCAAQVAVGNEALRKNNDVLDRMTTVMEVANAGRDHLTQVVENQTEAMKKLESKFELFSQSARPRH